MNKGRRRVETLGKEIPQKSGIDQHRSEDTRYLRGAGSFFVSVTARARVMFSGSPHTSVCSYEHEETPWGDFFRYERKVHLDSNMNWLDLGSPSLRSL